MLTLMNIYILFKERCLPHVKAYCEEMSSERLIFFSALLAAVIATIYSSTHGYVVAYGDAESHLNIAKRVVDSLTPGLAQLGGIWLPLPHLLLAPFVYFDVLWRTGLAGSIVSGLAFIVSAIYIYKFVHLVTEHKNASLFAAFIFILNPNILYLQSTPMTELVLIAFFIMSSYYFIVYFHDRTKLYNLVYAAFFGFCASLSRYDGWGLVLMEAALLLTSLWSPDAWKRKRPFGSPVLPDEKPAGETMHEKWKGIEGKLILFGTLAFFGIVLWFLWGKVILGDPLYFTHSQFSAKSQQNSWYERGELPSYKNLPSSILYYSVTSMTNIGFIISLICLIGLGLFLFDAGVKKRFSTLAVLSVPFIFNVVTLYLGQSVIFIPSLTPPSFGWNLFNVRYGVMMVPFAAFFAGYAFYRASRMEGPWKIYSQRAALGGFVALVSLQTIFFFSGHTKTITLEDGRYGLSSTIAKISDAELWFRKNYDYGKLLTDDFSRAISVIRTPIAMKDDIYIGNKPYWDESLKEPEKYARWIVLQKGDLLWSSIWDNPPIQARLFKYFNKVYTSDEVLIFKRIDGQSITT